MSGIVIGAGLLLAAVIVAFAVRRRWARRKQSRDVVLRRAARAARQIHRHNRRARRKAIRGAGTGVNSRPNSAAMLGNDGPVGLP